MIPGPILIFGWLVLSSFLIVGLRVEINENSWWGEEWQLLVDLASSGHVDACEFVVRLNTYCYKADYASLASSFPMIVAFVTRGLAAILFKF
ncbi:MAG: hypothetical protein IPK55_10720 [Streptococcus sp.]|nr:hypothetical protein [Streptococcus sp.]